MVWFCMISKLTLCLIYFLCFNNTKKRACTSFYHMYRAERLTSLGSFALKTSHATCFSSCMQRPMRVPIECTWTSLRLLSSNGLPKTLMVGNNCSGLNDVRVADWTMSELLYSWIEKKRRNGEWHLQRMFPAPAGDAFYHSQALQSQTSHRKRLISTL